MQVILHGVWAWELVKSMPSPIMSLNLNILDWSYISVRKSIASLSELKYPFMENLAHTPSQAWQFRKFQGSLPWYIWTLPPARERSPWAWSDAAAWGGSGVQLSWESHACCVALFNTVTAFLSQAWLCHLCSGM